MSIWALLQIVVNLIFFAGMAALWLRLRRPPQDDPRLSRGLQLLQTKITVLEDLSDRTDNQVKQLTALLDQKTRMLQNKVLEAEQQIMKIDHSMNKSLEVAEIFQDKIPHQEIVERQQKVEYVRAARMAHSGMSVDDIATQVALPREQIELIAKFNRDQLMFDEDRLPEWANRGLEKDEGAAGFSMTNIDFLGNLEKPAPDLAQMSRIENDFKKAVENQKLQEAQAQQTLMESKVAEHLRATVASHMQTMQPAVMSMKATAQTFREKLVSTAEELLRSQSSMATTSATPPMGATPSMNAASFLPETPAAPTPQAMPAGMFAIPPMDPPPIARPAEAPRFADTAFQDPSRLENQAPIKAADLQAMMRSTPTVRKSTSSSPVRADGPDVKRVAFPRIEK